MRYISLFSGVEAATLAWEPLGWEPVAFAEIEPFPSAVLAHRWPDVPNLGDVTKVDWSPYKGKADLVVGGSPCFVAGTLVLCEDGFKPIEEVQVGDRVLTHLGRYKTVVRIGGKPSASVIRLATKERSVICTPDHPFLSKNGAWIPAEDMMGRLCYLPEQRFYERVTCVAPLISPARVYNLEVEDDNSYTANGIAVHNCQAFSVAGKRGGLMDERGQLMLEYVRAVREVEPRWFLWENVCGVLSQDRGRAFGTLLREMDELGYGMAWRVLDAQFFGVAQRRRRVFLVGCAGGGRSGCSGTL